MRYKLIVSDDIEFTCRFTLNDGGTDRAFGARLQARRCPGDALDAKLKQAGLLARDLLADQGLALKGWEGEAPFVDPATGNPAPADADALADLLALPGMPNVVLTDYLAATGAKAKLGN